MNNKIPDFWFRITKGEEPGNFGQHPGCKPGDLVFKDPSSKSPYYRLEKSDYCAPDNVEVEPVDLNDLGVWHILQVLSRMTLINDKDSLKKIQRIFFSNKNILAGRHVYFKGKIYVVTEQRNDDLMLGNKETDADKKRIRVWGHSSDRSEVRDLSTSEIDELIDSGEHFMFFAIRRIPTTGFTENQIREIFTLATGFPLKKLIRLRDGKGFTKDIVEYPTERIGWYPPTEVLGQLDVVSFNLSFFQQTDEIEDDRMAYEEIV